MDERISLDASAENQLRTFQEPHILRSFAYFAVFSKLPYALLNLLWALDLWSR